MATESKMGRPSKYDPTFCDQVIAFGKEGMSLHEMALNLDVCYDTLNQWCKEKPEFSEAVKKARSYSQGWWEMKGRKATVGEVEGFNPTAFIFNMKNRFKEDWRDKHEVDNTSSDGSMAPIQRIVISSKPADDER